MMNLFIRSICFIFLAGMPAIFSESALASESDVYKNLSMLASHSKAGRGNGKSKYFFHDVSDSVDYFFSSPDKIYNYDGKSYSQKRQDISKMPLCKSFPGIPSSTMDQYNKAKPQSDDRKNFWKVVSSCLAAREGGLYMTTGQTSQFSKKDTGTSANKYIYGYFQLSTESRGAVDIGCQKNWKSFKLQRSSSGAPQSYLKQQNSIPYMSDLGTGASKTSKSWSALGDMSKQRFNVMCGTHEIYRGAVKKEGGKSCLNPFKKDGNRYAAFRSGNSALKACITKYVPNAVDLGKNPDLLRDLFITGKVSSRVRGGDHTDR